MRCEIDFVVNSEPDYFFLFPVFKSFWDKTHVQALCGYS